MLNEEWTKVKGLGLFPKEWSVVTAEDVATKISKGTTPPKAEVSTEGTIPFLRVNNLTFRGVLNHNSDFLFVSQQSHENFLERSKAYPGDILMNIVGPPLGKTALLDNSFKEFNMNQAIVFYRLQSTAINREFFLAFLNSSHAKNWFQSHSKKTSGQQNLTIELCKKIPIPLPNISEQQKIAQILSIWDKAITTTEQLLANSQQQKKALMQQLLTGKKRLLDENGVRFDGKWQWLKADEIFKPISKKNNSSSEELLAVTQDLGVLPRSQLERRVVMPEGSTKGYKLVEPGNFIISLRSFQGGLEYSRHRGLISPAYTVLKPIREINDDFFKHYYKSYNFIGHLAVAVIGIRDGKQISYSDFSFLKLPYPSVKEQTVIAKVLSRADREITALKRKINALNGEKKALMQQLLTGKRRVKADEEAA